MRTTAFAVVILAMAAGARTVNADERPPLPPAPIETVLNWRDLGDNALACLALTVYWEGRGESELGQQAVAHVVLNRARASHYPDDVCAVVTQARRQACQFAWWCDGLPDEPRDAESWRRAIRIAIRALAFPESDPTGGALYFHHKELQPAWAERKTAARVLGNHVFFRLARAERRGHPAVPGGAAVETAQAEGGGDALAW